MSKTWYGKELDYKSQDYFDALDQSLLRNPDSLSVAMLFRTYVDKIVSRRESGKFLGGNAYGRDYLRAISIRACIQTLAQQAHIVVPPGLIPYVDLGGSTTHWQPGALLLNYRTDSACHGYHVFHAKERNDPIAYHNIVNTRFGRPILALELYSLMRGKKADIWWYNANVDEGRNVKATETKLIALTDPKRSYVGKELYDAALKWPGGFLEGSERTQRRDRKIIQSMLKAHITGAVKTFVELCDLTEAHCAQLTEMIAPLELPYIPANPSPSKHSPRPPTPNGSA